MVVEGFATCLNPECDLRGVQRGVEMVQTSTRERASDLPVTITETIHHHLADDADMLCPQCGGACSLSTERPRVIPRMIA